MSGKSSLGTLISLFTNSFIPSIQLISFTLTRICLVFCVLKVISICSLLIKNFLKFWIFSAGWQKEIKFISPFKPWVFPNLPIGTKDLLLIFIFFCF